MSTEVRTTNNKKILYCCCYRPPDADLPWADAFNTFLNCACEQYQNIVISGDFNFPKIQWDELDKTNGVNELLFVELLNDHFPCQLNNTPTRGNKLLDLVITSVPNHVRMTEIYLQNNHLSLLTMMLFRMILLLLLMFLLKLRENLSEIFTTTRKET